MSDAPKPGDGDGDRAEDPPFEALISELEKVVEALERGQLPLEDALSSFERGMALAKKAGTILDGAERRVTELIETREGELREVPFEG